MNERYIARQQRDFYHYNFQQVEGEIADLGGKYRYSQLCQLQGGRTGNTFHQRVQAAELRQFEDLFDRRDSLLAELHRLEALLGLNVYTNIR